MPNIQRALFVALRGSERPGFTDRCRSLWPEVELGFAVTQLAARVTCRCGGKTNTFQSKSGLASPRAVRTAASGIRVNINYIGHHATPLYPQKLALTSPRSAGRSVGIVRWRTKATELVYLPFSGSDCGEYLLRTYIVYALSDVTVVISDVNVVTRFLVTLWCVNYFSNFF
jgi:hypothetical protein